MLIEVENLGASAIASANDSAFKALYYAGIARRYAVGSYKVLNLYKGAESRKRKDELAKQATLLSAKVTIDAYHASLYFDDGIRDTVPEEKPDTVAVPDTAARVITKLDVDQALFALLDEQLDQKASEQKKKLEKLSNDLKTAKDPAKVARIKAEIKKLEAQEAETEGKEKNAKLKLGEINTKLEERSKGKRTKEGEMQEAFARSHTANEWNKPILMNTELPMGLVYQVQIGIYRNAISPDMFKGLTPVFATTVAQGTSYATGLFEKMEDAQQAREYVKSMGLADAFVIAFKDRKKISTAEAMKLEKK